MELIRPLTIIFWSFLTIFFFCETGEHVTSQFDAINDEFYRSNWYAFPIEVQKMIPTILMCTQQKITINGFANLSLTRIYFKQVKVISLKTHMAGNICTVYSYRYFFRLWTKDSPYLPCSAILTVEIKLFMPNQSIDWAYTPQPVDFSGCFAACGNILCIICANLCMIYLPSNEVFNKWGTSLIMA